MPSEVFFRQREEVHRKPAIFVKRPLAIAKRGWHFKGVTDSVTEVGNVRRDLEGFAVIGAEMGEC